MSIIFPGNQVTHLNAYRNQGVQSIPGVNFYRMVGVAKISSSQVATVTPYALEILSPDLRQDDKPRMDKPFTVPAGATVYRTAINVENLSTGAAGTLQVTGLSGGVTLTAAGDGSVAASGAASAFDLSSAISPLGSETAVTATVSDELTIIDADSCAAIIVEVCYYMDAPAPDSEEVHLPYKTEAGGGY